MNQSYLILFAITTSHMDVIIKTAITCMPLKFLQGKMQRSLQISKILVKQKFHWFHMRFMKLKPRGAPTFLSMSTTPQLLTLFASSLNIRQFPIQ